MYPLCPEILPHSRDEILRQNDCSLPSDNLLDANYSLGEEDPFEQYIFNDSSLFEEPDTPSGAIIPALLAPNDMLTQPRNQLEPQTVPPKAHAEPPQAAPLQGTNEDGLDQPQEERGRRDVAGEQHWKNLDRQPSPAISESTIPLTPSAYREMMEEIPVRQERGASAGNPIPIEEDKPERPTEGDGRDGPAEGSEEEPKSQKRKRELNDPVPDSRLKRSSKRLKNRHDVSYWIVDRVIARKHKGPRTMYKVDWAGVRVELARISDYLELDDFEIDEIIDIKGKKQRSTALIIWRPSWVDAANLVNAEARKSLRVFEDKCASGESFWEEEDGELAQYVT